MVVIGAQIPKGYKRTEAGVIPEDWSCTELQTCLLRSPSYGIGAAAVPYSENLPTYIRITDITDDGRFLSDKKVSVNNENAEFFYLEEGDLVFARTGASVGKSYLYNKKDGRLVFAGFLIRIKPDPKKLLPGFLANYVRTSSYWNWVQLTSARSGQPGINSKEYGKLPVSLPSIQEQENIGRVLSDISELIDSSEKLLSKKLRMKEGAMQELLTGRKRLAGWKGKWEEGPIGDLGFTYGGLTGKTKKDFGRGDAKYIPFMNVMSNAVIDTARFDRVNVSAEERQNKCQKGDLFFNGSSETPEEVGMCSVLLQDVPNLYLNSFCFGFRLNDESQADGLFLAYFFRGTDGRKLFSILAQGATRYNLSKISLLKLRVSLPEKDEQVAIAAVLSDMDKEIEGLKQKINKYRLSQKGVMQQLLTGKLRLYGNTK